MSKVILRHLTIEDKEKFLKANNEGWEENFVFAHYWENIAKSDYETYIKIVPEFSKGQHIPKEHVPCTILFAFNEKGDLVGRTSIRHELTDFLLKDGGHVGYGVVPSQRKKGHATDILKETLSYISENIPTINKVLLTCDEGNIGSEKTIENNGGTLENILENSKGPNKKRYWISIGK